MRKAVIIIPARWDSSRFPGKPLAKIAGKSMLERVWAIAQRAGYGAQSWIATDDERIMDEGRRIGAKTILTSPDCANGTERLWDAVSGLKSDAEIFINLQGDEPLMPVSVIDDLIKKIESDPNCEIATPAVKLSGSEIVKLKAEQASAESARATTVTFDKNGRALYFSKSFIPFLRVPNQIEAPVYLHLGLYAYTRPALERIVSLSPGPFEQAEQLEQLRALEYGIPINVVITQTNGRTLWAVDTPEDIEIVEQILKKEGEPI